jgi:uncharacterized protein (TIGR02147 family)
LNYAEVNHLQSPPQDVIYKLYGANFMKYKISTETSVMEYRHYLDVLRAKIQENHAVRAYRTILAKAAGCQLSYLSQVLSESVHLTPEHAAGLSEYWNFSTHESEFFLGLVNQARASSPRLKELIESRLNELRIKSTNVEDKIHDPQIDVQAEQALYYSNWLFSAIHMIVSIPEYQTEEAISERLLVPLPVVLGCLESLERMGLVSKDKSSKSVWRIKQWTLHNPKDQAVSWFHHANWRHRALLDVQSHRIDGIHYTALHSLSKSDLVKFKGMVSRLIQNSRELVGPSKEEELVAFSVDLFLV